MPHRSRRWSIRPGRATATAARSWPPGAKAASCAPRPIWPTAPGPRRPQIRQGTRAPCPRPRHRGHQELRGREYAPPVPHQYGAQHMSVAAMRDQVFSLPTLIRETTWEVEDRARSVLTTPDILNLRLALITGSGDSHIAARAAQFAWQQL